MTIANLLTRLKPFVTVIMLLPAIYMAYQIFINPQLLGADPAKTLVDNSGEWALYTLLLALSVTPLRLITKISAIVRYRRLLGLYAAFYAVLHFIFYSVFLLRLNLSQIANELNTRPYIIVGFIAMLLYLPLVVTSTKSMQRRLKKKWLTLHKLVYFIGVLAIIHITWIKKTGLAETWIYALILVGLYLIRIYYRRIKPKLKKVKITLGKPKKNQ